MIRRLCVLLLVAGLVLAQEGDDSGISEDEAPSAESGEPQRTTSHPARVPGKKIATVTIQKKAYSLALPADWVLIDEDDPKAELAWGRKDRAEGGRRRNPMRGSRSRPSTRGT